MITSNFNGIDFDGTDIFSCDISLMNQVINDYNLANNTNYPLWDTVSDNFERFCQFLLVYCQVQQLLKGNDSFNIKITGINPSSQVYGTRGQLNSRIVSISFPFSNLSDLWGDTDNLG